MIRPALVLDFDGTATPEDVGGGLLHRFAWDPAWRIVDDDYENGRIGSRAAYRVAARVIGGDPAAWTAFALGRARLDPSLAPLVARCRAAGWPVEVLSDGLEFYIRALLDREGVDLPVRANRVVSGPDGVRIHTPHMNPRCGRCGTCKAERVEALAGAGHTVVYVGDGYSDLCAAPRAHRVFARDVLSRHLAGRGTPHERFHTLADVLAALFPDRAEAAG